MDKVEEALDVAEGDLMGTDHSIKNIFKPLFFVSILSYCNYFFMSIHNFLTHFMDFRKSHFQKGNLLKLKLLKNQ